MGLVRGLDAYVGIEIAEEQVLSPVGYPAGSQASPASDLASPALWYRIPLLSEGLSVERDVFGDITEIGTTGGREQVEFGRSLVRGEFTTIPRYDSAGFNILLAHALGHEKVVQGFYIDRSTTPAGGAGNSHIYAWSSTLPQGLRIRVYKSGQAASGLLEVYLGCLITGFTIEQPEGDVARATFRFVGHSVVLDSAGSAPDSDVGATPMQVRDLVNEAGVRPNTEVVVWNSVVSPDVFESLNIKGFTLEVDRKFEVEEAFITDPDNVDKPGITGIRDITLRIDSILEQKDPVSGDPGYIYYQYLNNVASRAFILMESKTQPVAGYGYSFAIAIPTLFWESAEAPIADGGVVNLTATGRATVGDRAWTPHPTAPDTEDTDLKLYTYVSDVNDSNGDHFTANDSGIDH
jgi:hypothetical protein